MSKYPEEYNQPQIGELKDPFRPEFRYDSRGRFIMPLPGYSKLMLAVEPGSKNIGQSSEGSAGDPQTDPGSLQTGYLFAKTAIKVGPEGGWVAQIAGGDFEYPFSYFNETTEVVNFYVDKSGNVYLKGVIEALAGGVIGAWTIGTTELYAGTGAARVGLRPGTWPFYAGAEDPTAAPLRINAAGQIWASTLTILGGSGIANLSDAGALAIADAADFATQVMGTEKPADNADVTADNPQNVAWLADAGAMAYEDLVEAAKLGTTIIQGGYIITTLLTASNIVTGILTALRMRTAATGERIEINSPGYINEIAFYDSVGIWTHGIWTSSGALIVGSSPSGSGSVIQFASTMIIQSTGDIRIHSSYLRPYSSGATHLGSATYKFGNLHLSGSISMDAGQGVDGVDISVHVGLVDAHHNALSNAYAITPFSVITTGSGTISTMGKLAGGHLNINVTSTSNYIAADIYITGAIKEAGNLEFAAADRYIKRGTDLHFKFEAANIVSYRNIVANSTGLNIGSAGQYWNEIHYQSLVIHTPKVLAQGLFLLETIQKGKDEKINSVKLHPSFKHKKGGVLMDNIIMANVAAIRELNSRLKKVES